MAKPADVRPGEYGLERQGGRPTVRVGYAIRYGEGETKEASLEIFVPMPDQAVAGAELDDRLRIERLSILREFVEALKEWQKAGEYIRR